MFRSVGSAVALVLASSAAGQQATIVPQTNAPIEITQYSAEFQTRGTYRTEGIRHAVRYRNTSDREIMATQIGLVSFNIFNEFLDRTGGIDMDRVRPGQEQTGTWIATALADFSFYTGVAYVSKVRFADGTIWEANLDEVTAALRRIEQDFDEARLRPGTGGGSQN